MRSVKSYIWQLIYPFVKNHYDIRLAITAEEKEAVYQFRHRIYRQQLNHHFLDKDCPGKDQLSDDFDSSDNSLIIYASRHGKVVGTLRVTAYANDHLPSSIINKYSIDRACLDKIPYIGEFRFFQIDSNYQKSYLAIALLTFMGQELMKKFSPEMLLFSCCQPGLIHYYLMLGCFCYTNNLCNLDLPILEIPIAYMLCDLKYLRKQRSIVYNVTKQSIKKYSKNKEEASRIIDTTYSTCMPHINIYKSRRELEFYKNTFHIEKDKHHLDVITSILKRMIIITVPADTRIITKNIIDYDVYLLLEGELEVMHEGKLIANVHAGSIFGEMALFDENHKRSNDVKSITPAKMIIIPRRTLHKLEKTNIKAANRLLRILNESTMEKLFFSIKQMFESQKS